MKHIILLLLASAVSACELEFNASDNFLSRAIPAQEQTLAHKAYYYLGLEEQKDRKLLKDITGVDPVTTEWCAAFVNMVLLENDIPTSAAVSDYPLMARSFLQWGTAVDEPKKGDIIVFERGESGWQGHVGFYLNSKIVNGQKVYYVLGGNQNDKVSIMIYPADKLLSIRRL